MSYLYYNDYRKSIEDKNLSDIIDGNIGLRKETERVAQEELISYLIQKYDTDSEFKDSNIYDPTVKYNANNVVMLDAKPYVAATTYAVGTLVLDTDNKIYKSKIAANTGHTPSTSPTDWLLLGWQNQLFYTIYPQPLFQIRKYYRSGDKVFWDNSVYTCMIAVAMVFPNDLVNGSTYWGTGSPYTVPVDELGSSNQSTYYLKGDSRSAKMVMSMCEITLYHLHKRIAPNNIPDIRVKAYDDVIAWLKDCASGNVTPNVPLLQTIDHITRIRSGARRSRNYNDY